MLQYIHEYNSQDYKHPSNITMSMISYLSEKDIKIICSKNLRRLNVNYRFLALIHMVYVKCTDCIQINTIDVQRKVTVITSIYVRTIASVAYWSTKGEADFFHS